MSQTTPLPSFDIRRILVPTDFSSCADAALRWADRLQAVFGAETVVLHVVDTGALESVGGAAGMAEAVNAVKVEASEALAELTGPRRSARWLLREGRPRDAILATIGEVQPDVLVMGTHGRTGLERLVIGSVAEQVMRESRVPVLVVRDL
jgi:nucleotide-binding universal stress UspA family protein